MGWSISAPSNLICARSVRRERIHASSSAWCSPGPQRTSVVVTVGTHEADRSGRRLARFDRDNAGRVRTRGLERRFGGVEVVGRQEGLGSVSDNSARDLTAAQLTSAPRGRTADFRGWHRTAVTRCSRPATSGNSAYRWRAPISARMLSSVAPCSGTPMMACSASTKPRSNVSAARNAARASSKRSSASAASPAANRA